MARILLGITKQSKTLIYMREANTMSFKTIEGHDCHPDAIECCGDCLKLNGYDVL